jgi:hypothetical protein
MLGRYVVIVYNKALHVDYRWIWCGDSMTMHITKTGKKKIFGVRM